MNRCSADWRQSDHNSAIELKVFAPDIPPRVKEPYDTTIFCVAACDIGTFVAVTVEAAESQVPGV